MISRRLLLLLLGAALLTVTGWVIAFKLRPAGPDQPTSLSARQAATVRRPQPNRQTSGQPALPPAAVSPHPPGSAAHREWIQQRCDELAEWAWANDPASLQRILAELGNSQPQIRASARAAARAFGSPDAIPWLEQSAAASADAAEQDELNEIIAYLRLPPLAH